MQALLNAVFVEVGLLNFSPSPASTIETGGQALAVGDVVAWATGTSQAASGHRKAAAMRLHFFDPETGAALARCTAAFASPSVFEGESWRS